MRANFLIGGAIAALFFVGAAAWFVSAPDAPREAAPASAEADAPFAIARARMERVGVGFAPALAAQDAPIATLPANILPPPNARVAVAPLFPGVVERIEVAVGDSVRKGQTLAMVVSRDALANASEYARADARRALARASRDRLRQLHREGIVSGARLEEAEAAYREASVDADEQSRAMRMAGAGGSGGRYGLVAPITGRVSSASLRAGDVVDGSSAAFVIDAVDRYEVEAQLPERLIGSVRPGMRIRLDEGGEGRIISVGASVDPRTRAAPLRASLPPAAGLVAGGATRITLFGPAPAGAVVVPAAALVELGERKLLFVLKGEMIEARDAEAGAPAGGQLLVTRGLRAGEQVVVRGTSELKAMFLAR